MTAKNSSSLLRKPTGKEDFVRGRAGQFPFSPGGLEPNSLAGAAGTGDARYRINEKTQLGALTSIPPGFTRGLKTTTKRTEEEELDLEGTELDDETEEVTTEVIRSVHHSQRSRERGKQSTQTGYEGIDDLLPDEVSQVRDHGLMVVPDVDSKDTITFWAEKSRQRMGSRRRCKPRNDQFSRTDSRDGSSSSPPLGC